MVFIVLIVWKRSKRLLSFLARRPQQMESMQKEFYWQFKRQLVKKYQADINESSHSYVEAKTYSSSSIIGGAYLLANPSTRSRFTKTEFLMAARWRLGIDLKHFPSKFICRCKDNITKKAPFGAHGEHCFVCKEGRGRNKFNCFRNIWLYSPEVRKAF